MILTADGEVAAVLDWELCTLGDPLADVGLLMVYWPDASEDADRRSASPPTSRPGSRAARSSPSATPSAPAATSPRSTSSSRSATGSWPASSRASTPATRPAATARSTTASRHFATPGRAPGRGRGRGRAALGGHSALSPKASSTFRHCDCGQVEGHSFGKAVSDAGLWLSGEFNSAQALGLTLDGQCSGGVDRPFGLPSPSTISVILAHCCRLK